ncbi:MAG: endonuclease MutS2, partial [Porphyromonadaceae bacterium]|nr:endonuclease MutS2 [Porphyromonadaceae bacterium]
MNNVFVYPATFESKIGFNEIRSLLKTYCSGSLGKEQVDRMLAQCDYNLLTQKLNEVSELLLAIENGESMPSIIELDVRDALRRIRPQGTYLLEEEL